MMSWDDSGSHQDIEDLEASLPDIEYTIQDYFAQTKKNIAEAQQQDPDITRDPAY